MTDYMLIAGCSHASGCEIDGTISSEYNRQHSFGNQLARKLDMEPINIAVNGSTNPSIARSVLNWFHKHKTIVDNPDHSIFVLVNWSESCRMEAAVEQPCWHNEQDSSGDWYDTAMSDFLQVNIFYKPPIDKPDQREIAKEYQRFMVMAEPFMEIHSANLVLQLQYFFQANNVRYLMANSGIAFSKKYLHWTNHYINLIDKVRYYKYIVSITLPDEAEEEVNSFSLGFYEYFLQRGHENPLAEFGHLAESAHTLYAKALYDYIKQETI